MHVMLNNYFDSYCQNSIGFLAENPKANILHELSYVYVKTHKCIPNIQKMKIKKKHIWDSNPQPSHEKSLAFISAKYASYAATGSTSMCTYCLYV